MSNTHIIIPDAHCTPGISNERFTWAANLVLERRPEVIICMGDLFNFNALSSYDKGRKSFEGRRYRLDIEAGVDALNKFNAPIEAYNEMMRTNKKAQYRPRKVFLLGNHEQRLERATNLHPELEGTITYDDLELVEHGWEVYPFLKPVEVDGIFYAHYFPSGLKGEAISGVNVAAALTAKNSVSSTVGHSHILDWAVKSSPRGQKIIGLSAGCFLAEEQHEDYAHATEYMWWRGLIVKHNVENGEYDLETIEMKRLRQLYS